MQEVAAKRLRLGMVVGGVQDLPEYSLGPRGSLREIYARTADAGYEAMQGGDPELCRAFGLKLLGSGVIPTPREAEAFVAHWKRSGALAATAIVGFGFESDMEMDELAGCITDLSATYGLPVYIETHRGSITQDAWRTVQLAQRVPQVRFNGDFSHWFTGQEMLYGDTQERFARLSPVFERTRFLHGRIGDRCCMQVDLGVDLSHDSVPYFRDLWIRAMSGFLEAPDSGPDLWFCPELLGTEFQYAQVMPAASGINVEFGDRWLQAQLLVSLARECFEEAK